MRFAVSLTILSALIPFISAVPISHDEIVSKTAQGLRLLKFSNTAEPVWKTEEEKLDIMREGTKFFDVTEVYEKKQLRATKAKAAKAAKATFPAPSHQSQVTPLLSNLSTTNMNNSLTTLTAFNNRYYRATTGRQASQWILDTVTNITSGWSGVTASAFTHSWTQFSIIVKIPGSTATTPITILGSHMDSINLSSPTSGRAPGADDDGSGTVNLIEILRVLRAANFAPRFPVEFHWYSGEEGGLLGSQAIAANYASAGKAIKAMMELDMTAYFRPGTTEFIALEADYVDNGLNTFVKALITSYSKLPYTMDTPCGYACSDHASWYEEGFPTTMPFEAVTGNDNSRIHTTGDTTSVSGFSWSHSLEFAKVALAFVYELTI